DRELHVGVSACPAGVRPALDVDRPRAEELGAHPARVGPASIVAGVEQDLHPQLKRRVAVRITGRRLEQTGGDRLLDREVVALTKVAVAETPRVDVEARGNRGPAPRVARHEDPAASPRLGVAGARRARGFPAEPLKDPVGPVAAAHEQREARLPEAPAQPEVASDLLVAPERKARAQMNALFRVVDPKRETHTRKEPEVVVKARNERPRGRLLLERELRHGVAAEDRVEPLELDGPEQPAERKADEILEHEMHR